MNEKKNALEPIIEKLYLLCYTKTTFSRIEKDILLQNLREAYMTILSMQTDECMEDTEGKKQKTENETQNEEEKQKAEEESIQEEIVIKEEKEDVREENTFEEIIVEKEEIPFIEEDIIEESEPEISHESDVTCQEIEMEPEINHASCVTCQEIEEIEEPATTLPKRSLNDLFTEKREERSLNAKFQNEKITDLTKSISINDKFLFIRELFNNKGEEFSRSLHILNQCEDIENAFEEMENMKKNYYWDSTSSAYLKLCDLIRRKF